MSFTDNLLLWLHIAIAIFAIGPLAAATMATPRYVRRADLPVLRFLLRITRIYSGVAVGVLIFGGILAQLRDDFGKPWLIVSLTLFVVALALLVLIMRDQRRAIHALDAAAKTVAAAGATAAAAGTAGELPPADTGEGATGTGAAVTETGGAGTAGAGAGAGQPPAAAGTPAPGHPPLATVERGRIATMSGVVSILWLVILAFMVWGP